MARALTEAPRGARAGSDQVRVQPPASRTRRRLPEILIGLLLVAGCALAAVVTWTNTSGRAPVLVVARPVQPGAALVEADLTTVGVAADGGLATLPATALQEVVGRVARVPLSAGTLLSEDLVAPESAVPDGFGIVGLSLEPGAFPTPELRAGDVVQVIGTPTAGAAGVAGESVVLVEAAQVFSVSPAGESTDRQLVAVVVPELDTAKVAGAAAQDGIRLAMTGRQSR